MVRSRDEAGKVRYRLPAFWRKRSLRFWLMAGMTTAVTPLLIAAAAGYYLHHRSITDPLIGVSVRHEAVLRPLMDVQLALWEVMAVVIDHASHTDRYGASDYEPTAAEIGAELETIASILEDPEETDRIAEARDHWRTASVLVRDYLGRPAQAAPAPIDDELAAIGTHINRLASLIDIQFDRLVIENETAHDEALAALSTSETLFFAAIGTSLVFIGIGVLVINRSLVTSMEELSGAAIRLAAGHRDRRVEVQIPHELAKVADAFNAMTGVILAQENALERAARTDGLTGLLNRREFDRLLDEEVRRADRYGTPVALVMVDLDHFKPFNDRFGHPGGDEALRAVAGLLQSNIRDIDKACRFGGEEFALILPESDSAAAVRIAERVRTAIAEHPIRIGAETASITASLGVATFPGSGVTRDAMLKAADAALYASKHAGRNRLTVDSGAS